MTIVNSKEFALNQKRYFDLAVNEDVLIKRGKSRFRLAYTNEKNTKSNGNAYSELDSDFDRAISAEAFREKLVVALEKIDRKYATQCE